MVHCRFKWLFLAPRHAKIKGKHEERFSFHFTKENVICGCGLYPMFLLFPRNYRWLIENGKLITLSTCRSMKWKYGGGFIFISRQVAGLFYRSKLERALHFISLLRGFMICHSVFYYRLDTKFHVHYFPNKASAKIKKTLKASGTLSTQSIWFN